MSAPLRPVLSPGTYSRIISWLTTIPQTYHLATPLITCQLDRHSDASDHSASSVDPLIMSLTSTLQSDTPQPDSLPSDPRPHPPSSPRIQEPSPPASQPPHSRAMQRVLSQDSAGSGSTTTASGSAVLATPSTGAQPLSPASGSGGVRTPKARKARLSEEGQGGRKDEQLAQDLGDLQVHSPLVRGDDLPSLPASIQQPTPQYMQATNGHSRGFSGSTESSSSENHPIPPSQLGSIYGADGFMTAPAHTSPYGYNIPKTDSPEFSMTPAAAAAIAAADEAIKQLNGTSTVYQGIPSTPGPQPSAKPGSPPSNPYQLPRGYANFVKPQNRVPDHMGVSRQSSTSSSTTEASTSSEESDLCIPRIEWVDKEVGPSGSIQNWADGFFTPYQPGSARKGTSPARMPPPASTARVTSPRMRQAVTPIPGQPGLPSTSGSIHPKPSSALPGGIRPEAMDEDDDDQTVGHRERSRSTSSEQSGLDLLLQAASHNPAGKPPVDAVPYETPYDGKGKRKAGAEAVDQWRNSGIPTGVNETRYAIPPTEPVSSTSTARVPQPPAGQPPTKKRRRSSALDEKIDPALLEEDGRRHSQALYTDDDGMQDDESEPDDGASEGDSEYGDSGKGKKSGARGRGGAAAGGRRPARGRASLTGNAVAGSSKTGTPTAGGGGRKGKKLDSPSGAAKGGRLSAAALVMAGGVQCDYTNPLPVCHLLFISITTSQLRLPHAPTASRIIQAEMLAI